MLRNYFKIALRTILRSKVYSVINISGLSLGISCCLLLFLYVQDEYSYDRHQHRLDDLYRVNTHFDNEAFGDFNFVPSISPPLAGAFRDEIPEIESIARVIYPLGVPQNLIKYDDQVFYETDGLIADSTVFDVLTYDLVEGNPKNALADANTVVLSAKMAKKIFGKSPALDKIISISQGGKPVNYKITGVFRDDQKSFLTVNFFTSVMSEGWGEYVRNDPDAAKEWAGQNFVPVYVKLVPGHSKAAVEKKMNDVLQRHGAENLKALGMKKTLSLEPIGDIYLKSAVDRSQRITYLYVVMSIAVFILLIACINFMNLSTAKATKRATEIGMRKVMGAFRSSLATQILGEAMIIVSISVVISLVIVRATLPLFNELSGKNILLDGANVGIFAAALTGLAIVTGLLAGSYPAFYISSFQPAQVLKGKINPGNGSGTLRQSLVVFQFMIAIVLVCSMILMSKQLSFMKNMDLGFNAEAKIVLPLRTGPAKSKYETLKKELLRNSAVAKVSGADYMPGSQVFSDMSFYKTGQTMDNAVNIKRDRVDADYIELLGIKMLAGRTFTDNRKSESNGKLIINKLAADKFGLAPDQAVGQLLHFDWHGEKHDFEVIGVMSNFNQTSLKEPIQPTLFEMRDDPEFQFLIASVKSTDFKETIAKISEAWKSQVSDTPFEYSFLDESIQKQYDDDKKISSIITGFTAIAIAICSLGLYGLSSFMAERRFKEIGIRKAMGASVQQIVTMMSKEFVKLVIIAFVLAIPLSAYCMIQWLKAFAYKTPVDPLVFVYAGASALVIALITVSFESVRASTVNPVKSLRNE